MNKNIIQSQYGSFNFLENMFFQNLDVSGLVNVGNAKLKLCLGFIGYRDVFHLKEET